MGWGCGERKVHERGDRRDTCTPGFTAVLFTSSTDEWIKNMWYIYTMECYSAIKKNEIMPFATTWMDLNIIVLRGKYHIILLICGILKKNDTSEFVYKTETDSQSK